MTDKLFRKSALERVSSPDQLDRLMEITPPSQWMALAALGLFSLVILGWAIWGRIPVRMAVPGALVRQGTFHEVYSPYDGILLEIAANRTPVQPGEALARVDTQTLLALFPGEVEELRVNPGDFVRAGDLLMTLAPPQGPAEVVLYLPVARATHVRVGMPIEVRPRDAVPQSYGYLEGAISQVSHFPSDPAAIERSLGNPELIRQFGPDSVEIRGRITGWSQGEGPPFHLPLGTQCDVSILLDSRSPLQVLSDGRR